MYAKLLIKAAILLLVINVAFIGVVTVRMGWLLLAIFNLVAIFIVLFQERSAFVASSTHKRILFTSDVFGWIAVGVGVIAAWLSMVRGTSIPPLVRWIFAGWLYYLLTVAIFWLAEDGYWKDSGVRIIGVIIGAILLVLLAWMIGLLSANSVRNSYDGVVRRRQQSLQSIVVDESVKLPEDDADVQIVVNNADEDNDDEDSDDDTADNDNENDTGSLVEPNDNLQPTASRIFDATTTSQQWWLTFANFLPVLFDTLDIPASTNNYTFTNVSSSSPLYPSFVLARDYTMIGTAINPQSSITCQTLMVLLGLAQRRDLDYTSTTVLDVFRGEAVERGYTAYGCSDRNAIAQWSNLP